MPRTLFGGITQSAVKAAKNHHLFVAIMVLATKN